MAALSTAFKTALSSYGMRLIFGLEVNGLKPSIDDSASSTTQILAGSEPHYIESTSQWFRNPWKTSVRFKRSAQHVLEANGGAEVVSTYGALEFPNFDKELDDDWGAAGYQTANQAVTVTLQVVPDRYSRLGPETAVIFNGLAESHTLTDTTFSVPVTSELSKLDTQLVTTEITVIDYPYAPDASVGRMKPLILGHVYNAEGISVDPLDGGGKFLFAYHECDTGTFYRNGLLMVAGVDYTPNLAGTDGASITLINGRQGARITGDIQGITPAHLGAFSDKLTELNLAVLLLAGFTLSEFDAAALTTLRATYDYGMGLIVTATRSARDIFRELNVGIPLFLEQYRDGELILSPWTDPSGTAEVTFVRDVEVLSADSRAAPLIREVDFTYAPYETLMTAGDLAGVLLDDDPDRVDRLSAASRTYRATVATADAQLPVFAADTRINSLGDITDLGAKVLALYGTPHIQITTQVRSSGVGIRGIGSVISFSRERLGLDKGDLLARVADMEEIWDSGGVTVNLTIWRKAIS